MARSAKDTLTVSGANTHIILEFANQLNTNKQQGGGKPKPPPFLYMGSAITFSYSVYRDKTPVFNCGSSIANGFAIGNKYVAGSLVTTMYEQDEFADLIAYAEKQAIITKNTKQLLSPYKNITGLKEYHTVMKDDLFSFNIHVIFTSEYHGDIRRIIVYNATFINNSQVMSIHDLITETTISYVAVDVREQHSLDSTTEQTSSEVIIKASDNFYQKNKLK